MADDQFVHDLLFPDSNTRRFHAGDACQWSPPLPEGEVSPETAAIIAAHRATIHAPRLGGGGRFGTYSNGEPIETSYLGVGMDPETGVAVALDAEGNPIIAGSDAPGTAPAAKATTTKSSTTTASGSS